MTKWVHKLEEKKRFDSSTGAPRPSHILSFIYEDNGKPVACVCEFNDPKQDNARLIASAPEMLEALKAMVEYFKPLEGNHLLGTEVNSAFKVAREAIAKAEGRAP